MHEPADLRVSVVTPEFPPDVSGVGDYVDHLARSLSRRSVDVRVVTSAGPCDGVTRPFEVLRTVGDWSWKNRRQVLEAVEGVDVVHLQYPWIRGGRSLLANLLPWLLRACGVPCVVTLHEFGAMRHRWKVRAAVTAAGAGNLICVDPAEAGVIRRWTFGTACPAFVPIGSNIDRRPQEAGRRGLVRQSLGLGSDEKGVGFFGVLYEHKGIDVLLEAAAMLRDRGLKVRPVVIGDFDRPSAWRDRITPALSHASVAWVCGAGSDEVGRTLLACDAVALPYDSGTGVNRSSMLAALVHGVPTVSTTGRGTGDGFRRQFSLPLVPPRDAAALAEVLGRVLTDHAYAETLRRDALRETAGLCWSAVARRHAEIYQAAARHSRPPVGRPMAGVQPT